MRTVTQALLPFLRSLASCSKVLVVAGLPALLAWNVAHAQDSNVSCYQELSSIDIGDGGWPRVEEGALNYKHVFQYKKEYPYFEYIGESMLGVPSRRWFPDGRILNFDYWHNLDGRIGSPSGTHHSIVERIYGRGNTHGISLRYSSDEEYAFLLFDYGADDIKVAIDQGARLNKGFSDGSWGVLAYVNGSIASIEQERQQLYFTCGQSVGYMFFDSRRLSFSGGDVGASHCAVYADFASSYGNEFLRSVFLAAESVEIAGSVHTQRKLCRRAWIPLAVTNSDRLRPILRDMLSDWGERVHGSVVAYRTAEAEAEAEENRTRWVKILEFPRRHKGNIHQSNKNDVRIEFRYLDESDITDSVYSYGYLVVNGFDIGRLLFTKLGDISGWFGRDDQRAEIRQRFEEGDFPSVVWNHYTSTPYVRDDNRYYDCNNRSCSVFVRASKLSEVDWTF